MQGKILLFFYYFLIFLKFSIDSIVSLLQTLLLYNMDDLCNNLQHDYDDLLGLIEKSIPIIWTNLNAETDQSSLKPNETDFNKLGKQLKFQVLQRAENTFI